MRSYPLMFLLISGVVCAESIPNQWQFQESHGACFLSYVTDQLDDYKDQVSVDFFFLSEVVTPENALLDNIELKKEYALVAKHNKSVSDNALFTFQGGSFGDFDLKPEKSIFENGNVFYLSANEIEYFRKGLLSLESFVINIKEPQSQTVGIISPNGFKKAYTEFTDCKSTNRNNLASKTRE